MQYKQCKLYPSPIFSQIINLERQEFKKDLRDIYQSDGEISVIYALDDNEVIAYITFKELDFSLDIYMLMVAKEYRNQNIASELLNNLKFTNLILEVRKSNYQAINFYEKHDFKKIKIIKNYYDTEDGIVMYREIL